MKTNARGSGARQLVWIALLWPVACANDREFRPHTSGGSTRSPAPTVPREDPSLRLVPPARFLDRVLDGRVGAGDELVLAFTMEVLVAGSVPAPVSLPISGDALGEGASWRGGPRPQEVTIELGRGACMRPQQVFSSEVTRAGAPSGVALIQSSDVWPVRGARTGSVPGANQSVDITPDFVLHADRLGSDPTAALAVGDVDGDGQADVVSAHRDQPLRLFLGRGDGAFDAGATLLGAREVTAVVLSDLDRDGDLDLVAASTGAASLVWQNDGSGGFQRAARMAGYPARALALGDLDCDGWKDIVLGADGAERVWFGRGQCTFEPGPTFGATPTRALLLGDLDGDGDLDLLDIADAKGSKAAHVVWTNVGRGQFEAGEKLGGNEALGACLADLDRDGDLDVVLGDARAARVLLNDGRARFLAGFPLQATSAWAPAVGDIDGDGILDLVQPRGRDTTWLRGTGDGRFEVVGSSLAASGVHASALADIDADGDLDLCLATDEGVMLAHGSLACTRAVIHLEPEVLPGGTALGRDLVLADLDGDGWQDVVSAGSEGVLFLRCERGRRFAAPVALALATEDGNTGGASVIEAADLDADGRIDLVAGGLGGARIWLADRVPLQFRPGPRLAGELATALRASDFDGDGRLDLALGTDGDPRATLWLSREASFEVASTGDTELRFGSASRMVAGDFDDDGRTDLAVGSRVGLATVLWRNCGEGRLEVLAELGSGVALGLDAADLDHDGDLDVLTTDVRAGEGNPCARIWGQSEDGSFALEEEFAEGAASTASFADLDGDGRLEVLLGFHDRACEIWRRGTDGSFELAASFGEAPTHAIVAADLDRDGDVDVLQGASQGRAAHLWWNE